MFRLAKKATSIHEYIKICKHASYLEIEDFPMDASYPNNAGQNRSVPFYIVLRQPTEAQRLTLQKRNTRASLSRAKKPFFARYFSRI